jgi:hypothetical protein
LHIRLSDSVEQSSHLVLLPTLSDQIPYKEVLHRDQAQVVRSFLQHLIPIFMILTIPLFLLLTAAHPDYRESGDDLMNVDYVYHGFENPNDLSKQDFGGEEVIRKPDTVKKQRLMDIQNDYFEFQAKKEAMSKSLPVR